MSPQRPFPKTPAHPWDGHSICLTRRPLVSQELPLALPLASAGTITRLSTIALFVLVEAASVEVPCALPDGEQVTGSFTLVNAKLARCILDALPLLQKPTGKQFTNPGPGVFY